MIQTQKWSRAILITGHARGGTTWLGDMLKLAGNSAYIFEPLSQKRHQRTSASARIESMHRERDFWMSMRASEDQRFADFADAIGRHITELYELYRPGSVETLLIKQPGIEWVPLLSDAIDLDQIVYIERNPIAVLNSYDRSGLYEAWAVDAVFDLCSGYLAKDRSGLLSVLDRAGADRELRILAMCCVAYQIAHEWEDGVRFIIANYEQLARGGPAEATRLAERLGLELRTGNDLSQLFWPARAEVGFLNTRKRSAERAEGFMRELAPWQLAKAVRFLASVGADRPVSLQSPIDLCQGSLEYVRRRTRDVENRARSRLSHARSWAKGLVGMPTS